MVPRDSAQRYCLGGVAAPPHGAESPSPKLECRLGCVQGGVWQATDTGACAVTHVFYVTDAKGNQLNTLEIRLLMVVGPDGSTMDGTDYATVMAPDGTVLVSGPGNTVGGTRLVVKMAPDTSAASPAP